MADAWADLEHRIVKLERRVAALEGFGAAAVPATVREAVSEDGVEAVAVERDAGAGLMALLGRSILILGGAFVLRAMTESHLLPQIGGAIAGLLYAAFWIGHSEWSARADRRLASIFDCATAAAIGFPLIFETTTRFAILSPAWAAILTMLLALMMLIVAARTSMSELAWIATGAGGTAFVAIAIGAHSAIPFMLAATLFAVVAWQVAAAREWQYVAWPAIATSDVLALALLGAALAGRSPHAAATVVGALAVYSLIWLAALASRSIVLRRELTVVEVAQLIEATLIGTAGAAIAARVGAIPMRSVGWFALFVAVAMAALMFVAARDGLRELSATASFAGGAALLLAAPVILGPAASAILWSVLAVAAAERARVGRRLLMVVHSALWISAAAIAGGLLLSIVTTLADRAPDALPMPWTALAVAAFALAVFMRIGTFAGARAVASIGLALAAGGAFIAGVRLVLAASTALQPMPLALLRTALLSSMAAALAVMGRWTGNRSFAFVARAVLVIAGLKIVVEDLRVESAAMLVAALTAYGAAMLIVANARRTGIAPRRAATG